MSVTINGVTYTGKFLSINGSSITIDGVTITTGDSKTVNIEIQSNFEDLSIDHVNQIIINGNARDVHSMSGSISVKGHVNDVETTSGSVTCGDVRGNVSAVSGSVRCGHIAGSVSTVTGSIRKS